MLRRTTSRALRYLSAVQAVQHDPASAAFKRIMDSPEAAVDADVNAMDSTMRLGGAKVLAETKLNFYGKHVEHPIHFVRRSPREAGLCTAICRELRRLDITSLTELQAAIVPYILRGKHVIAHAETGSGKSFGVALAICNKIARDSVSHRLHTIILVPTSELALQYDRWFKHFAGSARHIVFALSENVSVEDQLAKLHNFQPHVLVGTPQAVGMIMRHSRALFGKKLRAKVDTIIIDEADVVLRMPVDLRQTSFDDPSRGGGASRGSDREGDGDDVDERITRLERSFINVKDGADVVDRIFRNNPEELPAHIVALSATIDGVTARTLNGWMLNDDAVRLTTSVVEHAMPESLQFYMVPASMHYTMARCLETTLRLIRAQYGAGNFKVLILTEEPLGEIAAIIDGANDAVKEPAGEEANPFRYGAVAAEEHLLDGHHMENGAEGERVRQPAQKKPSSPSSTRPMTRDRHGQSTVPSSAAVGRTLRRGHRDIFAVNDGVISRLTRGVINVGIGPYHVARGLHIQGITHVIMYGEPPSISEFVHAAGRTGRNGAEGHVVALFPPQSGRAMQLMCSVIGVPWRTNRMAQVEALMEAEEAKDTKRALETSELLRRSAVDLLQSDTTRSTLSKSRLTSCEAAPTAPEPTAWTCTRLHPFRTTHRRNSCQGSCRRMASSQHHTNCISMRVRLNAATTTTTARKLQRATRNPRTRYRN
jgi:superfamily II DNA/RNA helicase